MYVHAYNDNNICFYFLSLHVGADACKRPMANTNNFTSFFKFLKTILILLFFIKIYSLIFSKTCSHTYLYIYIIHFNFLFLVC